MTPDDRDDEEAAERLRVTDRRRFTETGDSRDGEADAAAEAAAEAEAGAEAEAEESGEVAAPPAPDEPAAPVPGEEDGRGGVPPPDSGELGVATVFLAFWQGALMNLGAADPSGNRMPVNLDAARESIELLRVLQRKTAGNLSEEEDGMLRHLLHEVQLAYVQVAGAGPDDPGGEADS